MWSKVLADFNIRLRLSLRAARCANARASCSYLRAEGASVSLEVSAGRNLSAAVRFLDAYPQISF